MTSTLPLRLISAFCFYCYRAFSVEFLSALTAELSTVRKYKLIVHRSSTDVDSPGERLCSDIVADAEGSKVVMAGYADFGL